MKKIILISLMILIAISGCTSNSGHEHSDDEHDHSIEIEGSDIKQLTVQQVADLWEIDSQKLLDEIIEEFEFKNNYTTKTTLEEMREEYKFSPAIIKDIAEEIKQESKLQGV